MTPKEVIKLAKDKKAACVDLKFMDFLGTWQHFTIPMTELSEGLFEEGSGFDGSSIRGWQPINASDMLIVPDPTTAVFDPFTAVPTLSIIGAERKLALETCCFRFCPKAVARWSRCGRQRIPGRILPRSFVSGQGVLAGCTRAPRQPPQQPRRDRQLIPRRN